MLLNDSLNSVLLYNFQKFHRDDFRKSCTNLSPHLCHPCPFPLLTGNQQLYYLWIYFFFVLFTSLLYFLDSTYKWYHTVFVTLCLTSLSIMLSKSMHVVAKANSKKFILFYGWVVFHYTWTEQPSGLQSIASQRVRHDWSNWMSEYSIIDIYHVRMRVCVYIHTRI